MVEFIIAFMQIHGNIFFKIFKICPLPNEQHSVAVGNPQPATIMNPQNSNQPNLCSQNEIPGLTPNRRPGEPYLRACASQQKYFTTANLYLPAPQLSD